MNYHNVLELTGKTLSKGDMVNICNVGHRVTDNSLENMGGCQDSWCFSMLCIYYPTDFCKNICGYKVEQPDYDDFPKFKDGDLTSITAVALELMRKSEEQGYSFDQMEVID